MINPRPKHFKAKTQNLRDPHNIQQSPFVSNGEGKFLPDIYSVT